MIPLAKWKKEYPNFNPGDIVLVWQSKKIGPGEYRYGRVVSTRPDERGLVRSAKVAMRPRDVRENVLPYKSKALVEVEYPVQKLVMIHPGAEIHNVATERMNILSPSD